MKCSFLFIVFVTGFVLSFSSSLAQIQFDSIKVSDPFHYVRLYTDSNGVSHFSDEELLFKLVDFAPPAPPISVSEVMNSSGKTFIISSPSEWYGDWHPAPHRQLIFMLFGELEVEVSDGEVRTFGSGSALLVEDAIGKGHISRVVSEERGYMVVIPLSEQ